MHKKGTSSLRKRIFRATLPIIGVGCLMMVAVDWLAVSHIREHSMGASNPSQSQVSLAKELIDVLPLLIIPHLLILVALYAVLYKLLDREIFFPLLTLSTRFLNLKNGRPEPIHVERDVSEEVAVLYNAYNLYSKNLTSLDTVEKESDNGADKGE